jgi:hypothetical protein
MILSVPRSAPCTAPAGAESAWRRHPAADFATFLVTHPALSNGLLWLDYYSHAHLMRNADARSSVVLPDIKQLPSLIRGARVHDAHVDEDDDKDAAVGAAAGAPVIAADLSDDDDAFLAAFQAQTLRSWGHSVMIRVLFAFLERGAAANVRRGAFRSHWHTACSE